MELKKKIEDTDLSVRAINLLRINGVKTVEDLYELLDKGWSNLISLKNIGEKTSKEIILKSQTMDYDVEYIKNEIIDYLTEKENVNRVVRYEWESFFRALNGVKEKELSKEEQGQQGLLLEDLKYLSNQIIMKFYFKNIYTVEELIRKYRVTSELPLKTYRKWELIKVFDRAGYRFEDCDVEEFPNVKDFIELDKLRTLGIDQLKIDESIKEKLKFQKIDMSMIVKFSLEELNKYLSTPEIVELLMGMAENKLKLEICKTLNVKTFIKENIIMPIEEFIKSDTLCKKLANQKITTINQLISFNRYDLIGDKVVNELEMNDLTEELENHGLYLNGDRSYKCDSCGENFIEPEERRKKHLCYSCKEKEKRVKRIKEISLSIKGPDYVKYTNGNIGFTIFVTINNNSSIIEELTLKDFFLYHKNQQWIPVTFLKGYDLKTEQILPKSSLTAAKIWAGKDWEFEKLVNGDYITLYINTKEKSYIFKYALKNYKFEIDDYYVSQIEK